MHLQRYSLPLQKFVFNDLDLGKYDLEREMWGFPYAVIQVEYIKPERDGDAALGSNVALGSTTKIVLFKVGNKTVLK